MRKCRVLHLFSFNYALLIKFFWSQIPTVRGLSVTNDELDNLSLSLQQLLSYCYTFVKMPKLLTQFHRLSSSSYKDIWDFQMLLHNRLKQQKRLQLHNSNTDSPLINHLLFCEHKPVYTLGKSGKRDHLLITEQEAQAKDLEFYRINRGGDITYHGPGQITGYLILDLELLYRDVHRYVRTIEEAIIVLLEEYGLKGERVDNFTGVWVNSGSKKRKVCAIGVHLSRWVSMHGFGLNVNSNLNHFDMIVPCGIQDPDKSVTSISQLIGEDFNIIEIEDKLKTILADLFDLQLINI